MLSPPNLNMSRYTSFLLKSNFFNQHFYNRSVFYIPFLYICKIFHLELIVKVVSFFAGCGGLDLGFRQAGFDVIWANEFDRNVYATYEYNHPYTCLCKNDIRNLSPNDVPDCDGFIGGPPCQSWSVAGKQKGLEDSRGRLFVTYMEMIKAKQPKFFLIENVKGLLDDKFKDVFTGFLNTLDKSGYDISYKLLDAVNYKIPQNRERVFLVGFRKDLNIRYEFPMPTCNRPITLREAIGDIKEIPVLHKTNTVKEKTESINHDVCGADYGVFYNRGNRRRSWDMPSFTIHGMACNIPLHPSSPRQICYGREKWGFVKGKENEYRRLSVRECARIQTFPDTFKFSCDSLTATYKMIGNAVPPRLGRVIAESIKVALHGMEIKCNTEIECDKNAINYVLVGYYKGKHHLKMIIDNLIYYVRSDGRFGSMFKEDCNVIPSYIILHHKEECHAYRIRKDEPMLADASFLRQLGFDVNGNTYLCFQLDGIKEYDIKRLIETGEFKYKRTYIPYFTTIPEFSC